MRPVRLPCRLAGISTASISAPETPTTGHMSASSKSIFQILRRCWRFPTCRPLRRVPGVISMTMVSIRVVSSNRVRPFACTIPDAATAFRRSTTWQLAWQKVAMAGRTFERLSPAPILDRGPHDPWMVTTPWVLQEESGWRMWYVSGLGWRDLQEKSSLYHVKIAESRDGISWQRDGRVAVDLAPGETNIASPCVLRASDGYHMWYCRVARGSGYRLGYARSEDGLDWQRDDANLGIGPSESGWDSDCMAYPFVFVHKGQRHLLYSGNGNGRDGFGIAVEG